jgi:hypothetical protein
VKETGRVEEVQGVQVKMEMSTHTLTLKMEVMVEVLEYQVQHSFILPVVGVEQVQQPVNRHQVLVELVDVIPL